MKYEQLISHFGSPSAAAEALGIDRQRVHGWKLRNSIPTDSQIQCEVLTRGALQADIPQEIRRPLRNAKKQKATFIEAA